MNQDPNVPDHEHRIAQAETRTDQANTRTTEANKRTEAADARTKHAELETDWAHLRTDQANARTEKAETREDALRASELSYRRLFEAARDGILILDLDSGRIIDANPFLIELLGFSHAEMVGKTVAELSPFKDLRWNQAVLEQLQKDGYIRYEDLPLETKDGRKVAVEFISNAYQVGAQKVIQCNIRDITARKRAEAVLQESQQVLEGIINAIPVRVFWKNQDSVYLGCNLAFARDAGFSDPKDIIGKVDSQMGWQAQAEQYRWDDQQVIKSGCPKLLMEEPQTTPEGKTITLLTSKTPLRGAKGDVNGLVGTYLDITERKRMQESHDRLAMAVEQAVETVVITDTEGTILYVNPAFEKTTGYKRTEALGQNPNVLKSGRHDVEFYARLWATIQRGEIWSGHFINKRKDGTTYEEEATISPVRDTAGTIVNYVAVKRDVTREVKLEAQFRQAQKMEAIGQLAGGVAHDFNNMLAVIQMQTDLLRSSGILSAEQVEFADGIRDTVKRAAVLTRQLLLFSRREVFQPRDLELSESITNTIQMLKRILGEDIEMQLNLAAQPMFLHADAGMMDQVLLNLVVNARDAMPKGGQLIIETAGVELDELAVAQSVQARPGSFVRLSVRDSGCGIAPEILPQIFEPFFTTKGVGKGTGLGLATVFGIVQQHQGWINVYSEIGQGTTFHVYLPRLARPAVAESARPTPPAMRGGQETILLAEDDPALRVAVRKALAQLGYRILEAPTGVKALEVWQQNRTEIGLLLTDLVMPDGMTGKELAHRILQESPDLKVIYMSGYSAEVVGKDLPLTEGGNFLTKPFQAQKLAQVIRDCLDKPAGAG